MAVATEGMYILWQTEWLRLWHCSLAVYVCNTFTFDLLQELHYCQNFCKTTDHQCCHKWWLKSQTFKVKLLEWVCKIAHSPPPPCLEIIWWLQLMTRDQLDLKLSWILFCYNYFAFQKHLCYSESSSKVLNWRVEMCYLVIYFFCLGRDPMYLQMILNITSSAPPPMERSLKQKPERYYRRGF